MGFEASQDRQKRRKNAEKRQDKKWRQKNGPVEVRYVCPECGGPHSKADHGTKETTPAAAPKLKRVMAPADRKRRKRPEKKPAFVPPAAKLRDEELEAKIRAALVKSRKAA